MNIQVITELRALGYLLEIVDGRIKLTWKGEGPPDQEKVTPLVDSLKRNKAKAIEILESERENRKPYLDKSGDLVIPFDCDSKFRWWDGGQSIRDTLKELNQDE